MKITGDVPFQLGYNSTNGTWEQISGETSYIVDDVDFTGAFNAGFNAGDLTENLIKWEVYAEDNGSTGGGDDDNNDDDNDVQDIVILGSEFVNAWGSTVTP